MHPHKRASNYIKEMLINRLEKRELGPNNLYSQGNYSFRLRSAGDTTIQVVCPTPQHGCWKKRQEGFLHKSCNFPAWLRYASIQDASHMHQGWPRTPKGQGICGGECLPRPDVERLAILPCAVMDNSGGNLPPYQKTP